MATPTAKAAQLLRETADALDALPVVFRRIQWGPQGGYAIPAPALRREAEHIEAVAAAVKEAKAS